MSVAAKPVTEKRSVLPVVPIGDGQIRFLIAMSHDLLRRAVVRHLEADRRFRCVGQAANGVEVLQQAADSHPDVVLLCTMLPWVRNGLRLAGELVRNDHQIHVLILSSASGAFQEEKARSAGADGFLNKGELGASVREAVARLAAGGHYFPWLEAAA